TETLSAVTGTYTAVYAGTDEIEGTEVNVPVAVSAIPETEYNLTINQGANVTVTGAESGKVVAGTQITLTVTPAEGYTAELKVNGEIVEMTNGTYTFTMEQDTVVEATATKIEKPEVYVKSIKVTNSKLECYINDKFDKSTIKLVGVMSDGTTKTIPAAEFTITPVDTTIPNNIQVTITYVEKATGETLTTTTNVDVLGPTVTYIESGIEKLFGNIETFYNNISISWSGDYIATLNGTPISKGYTLNTNVGNKDEYTLRIGTAERPNLVVKTFTIDKTQVEAHIQNNGDGTCTLIIDDMSKVKTATVSVMNVITWEMDKENEAVRDNQVFSADGYYTITIIGHNGIDTNLTFMIQDGQVSIY
ncbi:MAG: hypothetical protein HFH46_03745, partial [Bacilli bacterium]|nr:hypothetical protein [Bacilli bacterium]